jgi:hypothetical protein
MADTNPFVSGNPVSPSRFLDRREALRRVAGRLCAEGQSTAVLGEPRAGKTSLLRYITASERCAALYGSVGQQFLFYVVDSQMLSGDLTADRFWQQALSVIEERVIRSELGGPLAKQYEVCRANQFGNATLRELFKAVHDRGWKLVLVIDDFHLLLHHPKLSSAEFFGGLRGLAQEGKGLAMVIAGALSLATINAEAKAFKPSGSPYLNFFSEVTLGPFGEQDIQALLELGGERFRETDRQAIRAIAGGQPFLLQAASSAMWDAHEDGLSEAVARRAYMGQRLYREHRLHFDDTWRLWSPGHRKAFTSVALAHTARLLPQREFLTTAFIEDLRDWGPELRDHEASGLLTRDQHVDGGWRVAREVMVWWLADELVRATRAEAPFEDWLRAEELDGVLTHREKQQLGQVVRGAVEVLRSGANTLVEAFAKGLVGGSKT